MTTLLTPARSCFAHRGAPSFLRPLLGAHENSTTLYSNLGASPGPILARFLSGRTTSSSSSSSSSSSPFSSNNISTYPYSPSCRTPPAPTRSPCAVTFRRHKGTKGGMAESLARNWRSSIWKDGYDPNFILTEYDKIPSSYSDTVGLPFSNADLTHHEVRNIFGSTMGAKDGNRLLKILHGRRVAGTLNHPEYFPNTGEYSPKNISVGLAWLRRTLPVDETLNAALRAEEELAQIEEEERLKEAGGAQTAEVSTTERDKGKGAKSGAAHSQEPEPEPEPVYKPDPIYGYSPVDEMRFKNQQEAKKREKQKKEERRQKLVAKGLKPEEIGTLMALDPDRIHLPKLPTEMTARMKEHQEKGVVSKLKEPPKMSLWTRLGPSTMFTLAVLAVLLIADMIYTPPKEHERLMPEIPFSIATMMPLLIVNFFVFIAWHRPQWWNFMNRFFILVPALPRTPSILLSAFSHQKSNHLWPNMISFALLGIPLCDMIGRADFLALTFGSAVIGNLTSLWWHVLTGAFHVATQGVSSVVCAFWTMYFYLNRSEKYRFGLPKEIFVMPGENESGIPGMAFLVLFMMYNTMYLVMKKQKHKVDAANHWSGIVVGLGAGAAWERNKEEKARKRAERRRLLMGNPGVTNLRDSPPAVVKTTEGKISDAMETGEAVKEK